MMNSPMNTKDWERDFRNKFDALYEGYEYGIDQIEGSDKTEEVIAFIRSTIKEEVARALEGVKVEKKDVQASIKSFAEVVEGTAGIGWNAAVDALEAKKKEVMKLYERD